MTIASTSLFCFASVKEIHFLLHFTDKIAYVVPI